MPAMVVQRVTSRQICSRVRPCRLQTARKVTSMSFQAPAGSGMSPELKASIDELLTKHKVVVFMKGTRQFPQCGFSNTVVQIMNTSGAQYHTVNVLEDDRIRNGMKEYSQWPTFPQVYIDGEFFGGCDIMIDAYQSGELRELLERVMLS